MIRLYDKLVRHRALSVPINYLLTGSKLHRKERVLILDSLSQFEGKVVKETDSEIEAYYDIGITLGLKGASLNDLAARSQYKKGAGDDALKYKYLFKTGKKYLFKTETPTDTLFLPELNMAFKVQVPPEYMWSNYSNEELDVEDLGFVLATQNDVYFPSISFKVILRKGNTLSPITAFVQEIKPILTWDNHSTFSQQYDNYVFSPTAIYTPFSRNSRIFKNVTEFMPLGVTSAILGSSAAGKSRSISDLLTSVDVYNSKRAINKQYSVKNRCDVINDYDILLDDVLILADEPSASSEIWYSHGDHNAVVYRLTQRIVQIMLRFYTLRHLNNRVDSRHELDNTIDTLNFFFDSITNLLYSTSKNVEADENISYTTFVKGVPSSVKTETTELSRSSGYVNEDRLLVTMIVTGNLPSTGNEADEMPFWNIVSGSAINALWLFNNSVKATRNRIHDFEKKEGYINNNDDYTSNLNRIYE